MMFPKFSGEPPRGGGRVTRPPVALVAAILMAGLMPGATRAEEPESIVPLFAEGNVADFFTDVSYDPAVPTPEEVLGFPLGSRPVRYDAAIDYLRILSESTPRAEMFTMGRTHEGRTLHYLVIGSEQNVANRESIRGDIMALTRPGADGTIPDRSRITGESPVIVWLAYSIHGDEISGVDAALWVAYHLVAATDARTDLIRDSVLILIDPSQNPDGRERYLAQIFAYNGYVPSSNASDLQHRGFWPWGRGNHYLFDMNRDWLPLVHPETHARVAALQEWNPQVAVDAHEMGSYSTYLFSPPREPINPSVTSALRGWWDTFAVDQGVAFDQRGWSYYTGDWHEEWYPGYSSWVLFTGGLSILYEQAGADGSSVRRHDKSVLTYPQAVAQQSVSSLATLTTAAGHRRELLSDYADFHVDGVLGRHEGLSGAFLLAPQENTGREHQFLTTIKRHGLKLERSTASFTTRVRTGNGKTERRTFPRGSYIIPLKQPRGLLAKAMMEFDPHLKPEFLEEERRELEKGNGTRLYEISGWSLALAYDLNISYVSTAPSEGIEIVDDIPELPPGEVLNPGAGFGFLIETVDDRSMVALAGIFGAGLSVRASEKPFAHNGRAYAAGTLLLRNSENDPGLSDRLAEIARATGVRVVGSSTNFSTAGPDLGSDLFHLLRAPRVGIFIGSGVSTTSCGALWYLLDHDMRMRQSLLDIDGLRSADLSTYNVLILPSNWGGSSGLKGRIGDAGIKKLKEWVRAGGTLIAEGNAAYFCADSTTGLSAARERGAVLGKLADYERDLAEYLSARTATVDTGAVWRGPGPPAEAEEVKPGAKPDLDELKRKDKWARRFRPRGVIMRLNLDPEHWLTFGTGGRASTLIWSGDALMAKSPLAVPARIAKASEMRMSGLLWPEARERWESTAYATRESMGKGQVILFADAPYFRAYFHGTKRLLLNAVLLGPGMGTHQPAPW